MHRHINGCSLFQYLWNQGLWSLKEVHHCWLLTLFLFLSQVHLVKQLGLPLVAVSSLVGGTKLLFSSPESLLLSETSVLLSCSPTLCLFPNKGQGISASSFAVPAIYYLFPRFLCLRQVIEKLPNCGQKEGERQCAVIC